jgi:putative tryptophan/tyrosine transport system substrate-binding protein
MNRRRKSIFSAALAFVASFSFAAAFAQTTPKPPRVGFVLGSAPLSTMVGVEPAETVMRGFVHGLRALGYVEGENVVIERRSAEGKLERLDKILRELADAPADVIVVTGNPMALLAKKVTSTVPVVVAGMATPVELGLVASLARPGGNLTGLAVSFGPELAIKRLELIRELLPNARRIAWLGLKQEWDHPGNKQMRAAATGMGLMMSLVEAQPTRLEAAFEEMRRDRPDAIYVSGTAPLFVHRKAIADFAASIRVADFYLHSQAVEVGGFSSYGHDAYDLFRRAAGYVDRILKGAKPEELPVEQIERFALVLNLKTARALALTIPQSFLLRADRVIE